MIINLLVNSFHLITIIIIAFAFLEVSIRYFNKLHNKTLSLQLAKRALLNNTSDSINEKWYLEYKKEAAAIFAKPVWWPFVYWKSGYFKGKYINIDRSNCRVTWQSGTSKKDTIKIFTFGGSTTWGWGARDNFTIPSYIAKLIDKEMSLPVTITNYGQLGYVSTQEIITLLQCLQQDNIPDIVIFYDGINDIFSAYHNGKAGFSQNEINRKLAFEDKTARRYLIELLKCSASYQLLKNYSYKEHIKFDLYNKQDNLRDNLIFSLLKIYFNNATTVKALAEYYGFKCLFYWQPVLFTKNLLSEFESSLKVDDYIIQFYLKTNEILKNEFPYPWNFFNISDIFQNINDTLFVDPWHTNERGNKIIAKRMTKDIALLMSKFNKMVPAKV